MRGRGRESALAVRQIVSHEAVLARESRGVSSGWLGSRKVLHNTPRTAFCFEMSAASAIGNNSSVCNLRLGSWRERLSGWERLACAIRSRRVRTVDRARRTHGCYPLARGLDDTAGLAAIYAFTARRTISERDAPVSAILQDSQASVAASAMNTIRFGCLSASCFGGLPRFAMLPPLESETCDRCDCLQTVVFVQIDHRRRHRLVPEIRLDLPKLMRGMPDRHCECCACRPSADAPCCDESRRGVRTASRTDQHAAGTLGIRDRAAAQQRHVRQDRAETHR